MAQKLVSVAALCAFGSFLALVGRPNTAGASAMATETDVEQVETIARLASTAAPAMRLEAGLVPEPRPSRGRILLDLQVAYRSGNNDRAGELASQWLRQEGVDGLLDALTDDEPNAEVRNALSTLLSAALVAAEHRTGLVDPWTVDAIMQAAVDRIGGDVANASILLGALRGRGREAGPELLLQVLDYQDGGGRSIGDFNHQADAIRLMQAWANGLEPEVDPILDATLADTGRTGLERARSASLLLHRDWRANTEHVLETLETLEVGRLGDLRELRQNVRELVGGFTAWLPPHERGEFLERIAVDTPSFKAATEHLEPEDAAEWSARLSPETIGDVAHAALRFRAGGDDALDAGLTLLPVYEEFEDFSAEVCIHTLLSLDGAGDPDVKTALDSLFERRTEGGDPFWRALGWYPDGLTDRQLEDGVLPYLLLTVGEEQASRTRLVHAVQARFPGQYESL
ncbi:MAG: hypothetical protein AAFZ65_04725 [Planctomycetota bacterium]